jgi:hypothetical protein
MGAVTGYIIYERLASGRNLPGVQIDWQLLAEMDYISGSTSPELDKINNQRIHMPGFMVPLEDDRRAVKEFLLVPSPQACIHVPSPPPNQMVFVRMSDGFETPSMMGPIWVYGKLMIVTRDSVYGKASSELLCDGVKPYR